MSTKRYSRPDPDRSLGQFISPTKEIDRLIVETGGDAAKLHEALLPTAKWEGEVLVKVTVKKPLRFNPRAPTADLPGANADFVTGCKTKAGVTEIAVDAIPGSEVTAEIIVPVQAVK